MIDEAERDGGEIGRAALFEHVFLGQHLQRAQAAAAIGDCEAAVLILVRHERLQQAEFLDVDGQLFDVVGRRAAAAAARVLGRDIERGKRGRARRGADRHAVDAGGRLGLNLLLRWRFHGAFLC